MTDLNRFFDFIKGKKIALVGLGISNTPLISMLLSHGAHVVAHDKKKYSDFDAAFRAELEKKGVGLRLGDGYLDSFDEDIIIKAPGIRCDAPAFVEAVSRGAAVNTPEIINNGDLVVAIAAAPTRTAENIIVEFTANKYTEEVSSTESLG